MDLIPVVTSPIAEERSPIDYFGRRPRMDEKTKLANRLRPTKGRPRKLERLGLLLPTTL